MWNQQGQDFIFGKRKENLEKDPDFQEYADLWRAFEYARGNFRLQDIPQVMGVDNNGTSVVRVAWIAKRLRDIPVQLQHLKARYPNLGIPENMDVTTTLQTYGDDVEYRDQVLLREMQKDQIQLSVKEAKLKKQWISVKDLIERLSKNRYARRMDPRTRGPNKQTPQGPFAIIEDLDIEQGAYSGQNEQRMRIYTNYLL